jgi:hypothetical protein
MNLVKLESNIKYLFYILKHKYFVLLECINLGILLRGILHDISKFNEDEWEYYSDRFYKKHFLKMKPNENFKYGFINHIKNNPHHWQWWLVVKTDTGEKRVFESLTKEQIESIPEKEINSGYTKFLCDNLYNNVYPLPMTREYILEMIADWKGASRALNGLPASEWYKKNKDNMILHPDTRNYIEKILL